MKTDIGVSVLSALSFAFRFGICRNFNPTLVILPSTENSVAAKSGGCFPGSASVSLQDGRKKMVKDLRVGDKVLAADGDGKLVYTDFIMFIDKDVATRRMFYVIETKEPRRKLSLTAAHLIFITENSTHPQEAMVATFASEVKPGQKVFVMDETNRQLRAVTVQRIYLEEHQGSFAPVTAEGTLVVDQVLASCYAVVEDHQLAHWAFAPVRFIHRLSSLLYPENHSDSSSSSPDDGVHWYPMILYQIGNWVLDSRLLHPLGMLVNSS